MRCAGTSKAALRLSGASVDVLAVGHNQRTALTTSGVDMVAVAEPKLSVKLRQLYLRWLHERQVTAEWFLNTSEEERVLVFLAWASDRL